MNSGDGVSPNVAEMGAQLPGGLRRTACLQCRQRKLKCDGQRPSCSNCSKPRIRGLSSIEKSNPRVVGCAWPTDEANEGHVQRSDAASYTQATKKRRDNEGEGRTGRTDELEARVAMLEKALEAQLGVMANHAPERLGPPPQSVLSNALRDPLDKLQFAPHTGHIHFQAASEGVATPPGALEHSYSPKSVVRSDWPSELPPVMTVSHIVDVFFGNVPTFSKMLRKPALREAIWLPPSHARFPARPLLHAILCITANYLPEETMSQWDYRPTGTPLGAVMHPELDHELQGGKQQEHRSSETYRPLLFPNDSAAHGGSGLSRFRLWHRRQALEGIALYADKGLRYLELLQATILVTASDQLNARWVDLWQLAASCLRLAVPMRLYQSHALSTNGPAEIGQIQCGDTTDTLEQAEKDRTWWMAFLMERTATMWSTWPLSLADEEIMTELPTTQSAYDAGHGELMGTQSIQDPDLYSKHPERHTDSLCFLIKAIKLFADSQRFFRFYQRRPHSVERYLDEPGLQILLSQVNAYRLSLPEHVRRPTNKLMSGQRLDVDQLAAVMSIHATMIVIAEPLVAKQTWKYDLASLGLRAVRAILSLVYDITATSYDLTRLTPSASYILLLAAKCLMRFADAANQDGDTTSAAVFRSEIGVFQAALHQYGERFPIGAQHAKALDDLVSEQERINFSFPSIYTQITIVEDVLHPDRIPTAVGFLRRPLGITETISDRSTGDTGHLSTVHSVSESQSRARTSFDSSFPAPIQEGPPLYAQLRSDFDHSNEPLGFPGSLVDLTSKDVLSIPNFSFDEQVLNDHFSGEANGTAGS